MSRIKSLIAGLFMIVLAANAHASPSDFVSPNVPLASPLYGYIEKFDGLGYLKSMPNGTKPYTRMQMAGWVAEIRDEAQRRPLPKYLEGMKNELERELAAELNVLAGNSADLTFGFKETRLELGVYNGDLLRYRPNANSGPRADFQPLNVNNNGYRYGNGGNIVGSVLVAGKFGDDLAAAFEPRFSYDGTQAGKVALNSGYIKTRFNGVSVQVGKDPVFWGYGTTGSLILGNNMTPLTSIHLSNLRPYTHSGFFRFLGEMNFDVLYSELESNRTNLSAYEVNSPSYVGVRGTFTPQRNFTFGLSFASMVGGEGRELSGSDYWKWLTGSGTNPGRQDDKWNSISGLDFKVRVPRWGGTQFYAEFYGEDKANGNSILPERIAERVGVYLPKLSKDGSWDMKLEYARTSNWWYTHQLYTNGYVYKGNIIGDPAGYDAMQYYVQIGRYLSDNGDKISINLSHLSQNRHTSPVQQTLKSLWIQYQVKLREKVFLDSQAGIARVNNADFAGGKSETNRFAGVSVRWLY